MGYVVSWGRWLSPAFHNVLWDVSALHRVQRSSQPQSGLVRALFRGQGAMSSCDRAGRRSKVRGSRVLQGLRSCRLSQNIYRTKELEGTPVLRMMMVVMMLVVDLGDEGDDDDGDDGVLCSQMLLSVQLLCPLNHLNVVRRDLELHRYHRNTPGDTSLTVPALTPACACVCVCMSVCDPRMVGWIFDQRI